MIRRLDLVAWLKRSYPTIGAVLLVGAVYLWNLGSPPLWGDEAGTGVFARNVLRSGYPTGFDGRNLSIYGGGAELNENLVVVKIPWVQFYVGALSLELFGDTTRGLRTLFALAGVLALFPLRAVLRGRVPCPLLIAVGILLSPQLVLFHRNARYYPLLTLWFALITWIVCERELSARKRVLLASVCFVLMFHTHPVAATTCTLAVLCMHALQRSALFFQYLFACVVGFASWFGWYKLVGPMLVEPRPLLAFASRNLSDWIDIVVPNVRGALVDLDAINCTPVLAWVLVLAAASFMARKRLRDAVKDPLVSFTVLAIGVHVLVITACFESEMRDQHLNLRYMPHLIAFGMTPLLVLLATVVRDRRLFLPISAVILGTNVLTLSCWMPSTARAVPLSWWPATYGEILEPHQETWDEVMREIRSRRASSAAGDETLMVLPNWLQEVAIFYLGSELTNLPDMGQDSAIERRVRTVIGAASFAQMTKEPDWVVMFDPKAPASVPGFERITVPVHRARPDDGTRPELNRHAFWQERELGVASIYRKVE